MEHKRGRDEADDEAAELRELQQVSWCDGGSNKKREKKVFFKKKKS
jgi:hypothetical protein